MPEEKYVTALSLRWLTPLYDTFVEGPMSAMRMRRDLLQRIGDSSKLRLLDVGSGTGTFAILVKRAYPDATVVGLDGDAQILAIARSKAEKQGLTIEFKEGMSFALPFEDGSFDVVTTSLMLHHLSRDAKQKTAAEMYRVLRPGGRLLGLDFAAPRGPLGRSLMGITRHFERVADNVDGLLPVMFGQAGFKDYTEDRRYVLGSIALFHASKQG